MEGLKPRPRFGGPQRREENHHLTDEMVRCLEFIHLHGGMLPTNVIHEGGFWKHIKTTRLNLMNLHHHFEMLERPVFQRRVLEANKKQIIHKLSPKAVGWLRLKGLYRDEALSPHGSYQHNMAVASIYACFAIEAKKRGIPFTHHHDLLKEPIQTAKGKLHPDAVFLLSFPQRPLLVFLEVDRNNEPGQSASSRKSWKTNIEQYDELIYQGDAVGKRYKKLFNLPTNCAAVVMAALLPNINSYTTSQSKLEHQLKLKYSDKCNYFLYRTFFEFGDDTHSPGYIPMFDLTWNRFGATSFKV